MPLQVTKISLLGTIILCFLLSLVSQETVCAQESSEIADYIKVADSINFSRILDDVRNLTGFGRPTWSRVSGYPGFYAALDHSVDEFEKVGLEPLREFYEITVPVDYGAYIVLQTPTGEMFNITAYPLWPNNVNPCPYSSPSDGDSLIYGGYGFLTELNNKTIEDRWVLMEFDSRWYWKNPVLLGARGIIFREPETFTTRIEAEQKVLGIPYDLPRIYVKRNDGDLIYDLLSEHGQLKVHVKSMMRWEKRRVSNILAQVQGTSPSLSGEAIVISAFSDSFSVVPSLNPGATDAFALAALLELARYFADNPPERTVIFLVTSGHWQSLWGAREFVDKHFSELGFKIKAFIGLDITPENDRLGVFHVGSLYLYKYPDALRNRYRDLINKFFFTYLPSIERQLGKSFSLLDMVWMSYPSFIIASPPRFAHIKPIFDHEPFTAACYGGGFTLATTDVTKAFLKTPLDTLDVVLSSPSQVKNLKTQLELIFCILSTYADDDDLATKAFPSRFQADQGWATLTVQAAQYNLRTAWYDPWNMTDPQKVIVRVAAVMYPLTAQGVPIITGGIAGGSGIGTVAFLDVVVLPDEQGTVRVVGLKPYSGGSVTAHVINQDTGIVEYAYDSGVYSAPPVPSDLPIRNTFLMMDVNMFKYVSLFETGTITLLNFLNPQTLSPIGSLVATTTGIRVLNFLGHGPPVWGSVDISLTEAMVYGEPGIPVEIIAGTEKYPLTVLLNASEENPSGDGYLIKPRENIVLTTFDAATELFGLANGRISILESRFTFNPKIRLFHPKAIEFSMLLEESLASKQYDKAYSYAVSLWGFDRQAYMSSMDLMWEVIATAAVFFLMMIPFAFLSERLMSQAIGLKRITMFMMIFVGCILFLVAFHPGYSVATNMTMILVSIAIAIMVSPLIVVVLREFLTVASMVREEVLGLHFAEISRAEVLLSALSIGIQNMRKRKFRTILTLLSITLLAFSLMVFTSTASTIVPYVLENPKQDIYYDGMLVRKYPWSPIPEELFIFLKYKYGDEALVVPRAWIIPPFGSAGASLSLDPQGSVTVKALIGLTPEEEDIFPVRDFISNHMWIPEGESQVCFMSYKKADELSKALGVNITYGSKINIWGWEFTLMGLYDATWLSGLMDLDGEPFAPVEYIRGMNVYSPPHTDWDDVIIIPYLTAMRVYPEFATEAPIHSVAIKLDQTAEIDTTALELALGSLLDIYYSKGDSVFVVRPRSWFSFIGMETLQVPMIIVGLSLVNITLGAVYERLREISVYSTIGLSPGHVSGMFLAENLVYAVIGSMLGYMIGVLATVVLWNVGLFPAGLYPNFSSILIGVMLGFATFMTTVSAMYPAYKASRLVTPSLERKWRLPTKPVGNQWTVPLPFVASSREEVKGVLWFLREFFGIHSSRDSKIFIAEETEYMPDGISSAIRLSPYDGGIIQNVSIKAIEAEKEKINFELNINRISGVDTLWKTSNYTFVDALRKQLLIWRSLSPDSKELYIRRAGT